MKRVFQIAALGLLSVMIPAAGQAQDRDGDRWGDRNRGWDRRAYYEPRPYPPPPPPQAYYYGRPYRDAGRSAAIIGGSAMAGAMIGGAAGQGRGAAVGALIGGFTGLIVDQATCDHRRY